MKLNSIFKHIILCFAVILSLIGFTSCSDENGEKIVEISNVDYGFLETSKINDFDQVVIENAKKPTNFDVGTDYFFILQFSITARTTNTESLTLQTTIEIENSKFLNGELNYTNSGNAENNKIPITNADTGEKGFKINSTHTIPQDIDDSREVKIIIRINTLNAGNTLMKYNFSGDNLKLIGECDGLTRSLVIDKVQIEQPVITYNSASIELHWSHVKNADYYKIYVDGTPLMNGEKPVIYETDEYVAVGAEIVFFISNYISGVHRVKIQAFSNNANYLPSAYSNEVDVIF